jgi:hypothetical protein
LQVGRGESVGVRDVGATGLGEVDVVVMVTEQRLALAAVDPRSGRRMAAVGLPDPEVDPREAWEVEVRDLAGASVPVTAVETVVVPGLARTVRQLGRLP